MGITTSSNAIIYDELKYREDAFMRSRKERRPILPKGGMPGRKGSTNYTRFVRILFGSCLWAGPRVQSWVGDYEFLSSNGQATRNHMPSFARTTTMTTTMMTTTASHSEGEEDGIVLNAKLHVC